MANEFLGECWVVCDEKRNPCGIVYSVNRSQIMDEYSENHEFEKLPFLSNLQLNIEDTQKYLKYHFYREQCDYMDYLIPALEQLFLEVELTGEVPSFVQVNLKGSQDNTKPKPWFREECSEGHPEIVITAI